ncbi:MAG TPA: serine/threonine-protein kinase [Burkholderiales bacterium]|nr:serine/threonine-protein kinase [Burkholderiales bacterium]
MNRIGKYEVVRELGKGATSIVYLARDSFANREVAIKLVHADALRDQEYGKRFRKLFLTEASLAGKLSHPHIATIYDAASEEAGSYLVMEYVSGGTLEQHIAPETLLPIKTVMEIAFKCCKALDYAHQRGIIHRDIKPANILLTDDSDIKITDFGAALNVSSDTTQISGIGSPAYMSPEQLNEASLTHHTDMFSLAVVIYQLLTGHLPFDGTTGFGMMNQILTADPAAPSAHRPQIPARVDETVLVALRKEPGERYATWEEFAQQLANAFGKLEYADDKIADAEKFSTLRRLDFFRRFTDVDLWQVLRIAEWVRYGPDDLVIREGDVGTAFYIVVSGEVRVTKQGKVLNILGTGDCFGEMSYVGSRNLPRTASVVAADTVTAVRVSPEALSHATQTCAHAFDSAFLELLVSRLESANIRLSSLLMDGWIDTR